MTNFFIMFVLQKTANYTDFPCHWCKEGSVRYAFNLTAVIALGVILGIFALLIFIRIRTRSKKLADTAKKISQFDKAAKEREKDELKRLLSILETIHERLGEKYEIDQNDYRELLDFDPNYLFDAMDEDKNNVLTYAEFDKAMVLTDEKLLAFIKMMNEADHLEGSFTSKDQNQVSRETFVKHFLPVIKRVAYFDPSSGEIDNLFDEINKDGDKISVYDLKYSSLAMFLADHDVRKLEVFFRNKLAKKKYGSHNICNKVYDLSGGENFVGNSEHGFVDDNSFEGKEDFSGGGKEMEKSKRFRKSLSGPLAPGQSDISHISKSEFRDWLPEALEDLVRADDSAQEPIDIYFKDLTLDVNGKDGIKNIVNGITGRIEVGKMTAVMGKYLSLLTLFFLLLFLFHQF